MTPAAASPAPSTHEAFHVGTLTYTKAALFSLFIWLLWGDFCFMLMETAAPAVLQVNLNDMGAPNWVLGLILSTIPGILNMTVCPASSFYSDRFRSRWGRRIPFLFAATIPLTLFLGLLGFSRQIGAALHALVHPGGFSQSAVTVTVVCVLVFGFQLFNMVVASVYYYLFNDVVPAVVLARFMSLFRIVGVLSGAAFNWFFLKYAVSHMTEVYLIAAGLYCVAFLLMCWRVKEGEYPPPPVHPDGGSGVVSGIKTFFTESFSIRFYWLFFLANTFWALTGVTGSFVILQAKSIGVDLDYFGKVAAVAGIVTAVLMYPAGIISDRRHPLRVLIWATIALLLIQPLWLVFLFHDFSPSTSRAIFTVITMITYAAMALYFAAELPMYMRILPKSRYGQFSSANALVRSFAVIVGGLALGLLLDHLAVVFPAKDYCYRFIPLWFIACAVASLFFLRRLYAEWQKRGGETSYQPPGFNEG
jgi:MFS family permease